ncbi:MAG: hypothetical protein GVY26_20160 [Bacteroidetes bacterium]|jgi:hypothetical protein|nr:hypothetical protein [Bacteroidota bacterium]
MNLEQAKVTLDKINSLFNSLQHDGGKVSSIERDLMLSYVKQLYESFLHESASANSTPSNEQPALPKEEPAPIRRGYTPPRIIEVPDSRRANSTPPSPDPSRQPQPKPRPSRHGQNPSQNRLQRNQQKTRCKRRPTAKWPTCSSLSKPPSCPKS